MTLRSRILAALAALVLVSLAAPPAGAALYEVTRQEQSCPKADEPRALRQTVVVLDEAIVAADAAANQRWVRMVVEAADAGEVSRGGLGVRERFALFVARRDGTELVPLMVGCSPNLSDAEFQRQKAEDTAVDRFIGRDAETRRKAARTGFADGVAKALGQIQRQASDIAAQPAATGTLLRAIQNAGALAASGAGTPRFIVISPFALVERSGLGAVPAARARGFALAKSSGVDLGRAEVYLAGAALGDGPALEFARAFLLGSKGWLAGVRSDGLPQLAPEPTSVTVFEGFVDYVGQRTPMQVRLATAAQGDLVNSWVETTVADAVATPLAGKVLCRAPKDCELRGDGRFAAVWFEDPQQAPADRGTLPFGGARNVAMAVHGDVASGSVSDPKVRFRGEDAAAKPVEALELKFEINRVEGSPF